MTDFILGKNPCPKCRENGEDRSGDNFTYYGEGNGGYCYKCGFTVHSDEWLEENTIQTVSEATLMGTAFDEDIHAQFKLETGLDSKNYRGVRTDISKWFGVRYKYHQESGEVIAQYYPVTIEEAISGYKPRVHPKTFTTPLGEVGKCCDMFGEFRFKTFSDIVVIVGGELDQLSAFQMLSDAQKDKKYNPVAVVSPTIGETGGHKQVQARYQFFNRFKKIILCLDNDKAGQEATASMAKVLPRGKVYIMNMRRKDPNSYIWDKENSKPLNHASEFINDFWAATPYTPAGIHASTSLYQAAIDRLDLSVIALPEFMSVAAKMLGGGFVRKEIALLLAKTSIGKTLFVTAITEYVALKNKEDVVGVLSLEADAGKFSMNLLSYHLKTPLHRFSKSDRRTFLEREDIKSKVKELYEKEDGTPTLYVCDDRGASFSAVKEKVLEMIIQFGVTILIVDPYSDLLSGMSVSEQEDAATWFKKIMKEYDITPIIISHVRKSANGSGNQSLTEDDAQGSSFLVKAAGQTLALERDKQAEDPVERNRTYITILKNRDFSETGPAGSVYFDVNTGSLNEFEKWAEENNYTPPEE